MLSLIINLSELVVDRGISPLALARLMILKLPSLVVLALPISGLSAMFLGLGRLTHDREIIALEAAGISLRRGLSPLLVVAVLVAAADFALYNWGVPSSEGAFQRSYLAMIYRQGAPRLQSDTFFKGPEGEVLYARRYNQEDGSLSDVLVYDHVGRLFHLQDAAVTIISAERGAWSGDAWELQSGRVYGVDDEGRLIHTATFETLTIPVEATPADFFVQSRQPTEMGIAELRQRIATLEARGLSADGLVLECHRKVAIPLATLVFVLLGGTISLIFGWRSRAAGIVLSFLLIGAYQGVFLWTGTLGERGILPAALAAWLPNLAFGVVGVALFVRLDRLSSRDLWRRVRRAVPFLGGVAAGSA
jgi:LPS export ABC transporter permease LptG